MFIVPYLSRITSLKGFNNILLGRDLSKVLKPGVVYGIIEVMGVIMIEEIGEQATARPNGENRTIGQIVIEGVYCLTKEEYAAQLKKEEE